MTHPAHGRAHRGGCSDRKAAAPGGSSAGRPLEVQASWRFFWFLSAGTMKQGINISCTGLRGAPRRVFRPQSGSPWGQLCRQAPGGPLLLQLPLTGGSCVGDGRPGGVEASAVVPHLPQGAVSQQQSTLHSLCSTATGGRWSLATPQDRLRQTGSSSQPDPLD